MKKTLFLSILTFFIISASLYADEKKCKAFNLLCKSKQFINETKDFQKQGIEKTKDQLKNTKINK